MCEKKTYRDFVLLPPSAQPRIPAVHLPSGRKINRPNPRTKREFLSVSESRPVPIDVPRSAIEEIYRHARETFPEECCGWLTGDKDSNTAGGVRRAVNAYESDLHPTASNRTAERAYVISNGDLLELAGTLDDDVRPRIIYHSHPIGRAYFSETDRANARDPWGEGPAYPVQQIVIGIDEERVVVARQFAWDDLADDFVEIAEFEGADV